MILHYTLSPDITAASNRCHYTEFAMMCQYQSKNKSPVIERSHDLSAIQMRYHEYFVVDSLNRCGIMKMYGEVFCMGRMAMRKWSGLICTALAVLFFILPGCNSASAEFVDDFSDPASGWGAASHETYIRGYQQGEYLIQIDVPQWFVWTTAGRSYEDVEILTSARTAGQTDNHYGAICRFNDEAFYYFAISSDGYYAIFEHNQDGELLPLTGADMLFTPLIGQNGADNQIRALCQGNVLSLYVNGQMLAEIKNDDLVRGDIGMAAGTVKKAGTSIWFDDFEVKKP
jgi:hypothetical protein